MLTRFRRPLIAAAALAAALPIFGGASPVDAKAKAPPAHQTLQSIAQGNAKARTADAKARAKGAALQSTANDVAALVASAQNTVAKANVAVNADAAKGDLADELANVVVLYAATDTLDKANQVAADLAPPPPPPTTTTTTAPVTTTSTTTLATTTTTTQPNAPPASPVGLYTGSVSSALSLGKTLGLSPLTGYSYYCDGTSWSSIASCAPASGLPAGTTLLVGVDLTPNKTGLSAVAANVSAFSTLGKHFVGTSAVFRVGWEFDGSWMPWGTGANGNTAAQFAPASALAINAIKASDPAARFDFSDNTGTSSLAQLKVYMGNNASLWTYVGGDHYDNVKSTTGGTISAMTATIQLASSLGKPFSEGEWGLNGSDDTKFIASECQAIYHPAQASAANNWPSYTVGPTSYFSADLQINSDITQFPNSVAAYKADCR